MVTTPLKVQVHRSGQISSAHDIGEHLNGTTLKAPFLSGLPAGDMGAGIVAVAGTAGKALMTIAPPLALAGLGLVGLIAAMKAVSKRRKRNNTGKAEYVAAARTQRPPPPPSAAVYPQTNRPIRRPGYSSRADANPRVAGTQINRKDDRLRVPGVQNIDHDRRAGHRGAGGRGDLDGGDIDGDIGGLLPVAYGDVGAIDKSEAMAQVEAWYERDPVGFMRALEQGDLTDNQLGAMGAAVESSERLPVGSLATAGQLIARVVGALVERVPWDAVLDHIRGEVDLSGLEIRGVGDTYEFTTDYGDIGALSDAFATALPDVVQRALGFAASTSSDIQEAILNQAGTADQIAMRYGFNNANQAGQASIAKNTGLGPQYQPGITYARKPVVAASWLAKTAGHASLDYLYLRVTSTLAAWFSASGPFNFDTVTGTINLPRGTLIPLQASTPGAQSTRPVWGEVLEDYIGTPGAGGKAPIRIGIKIGDVGLYSRRSVVSTMSTPLVLRYTSAGIGVGKQPAVWGYTIPALKTAIANEKSIFLSDLVADVVALAGASNPFALPTVGNGNYFGSPTPFIHASLPFMNEELQLVVALDLFTVTGAGPFGLNIDSGLHHAFFMDDEYAKSNFIAMGFATRNISPVLYRDAGAQYITGILEEADTHLRMGGLADQSGL